MAKKFLDSTGLQTLIGKIKGALNTKQNKLTSTSPLGTGLGGTGRTTLTGAASLRSDLGLGTGSGALQVANGGTGTTSLTSGNVLVGAGSNAITTIAKTNANTANTLVQRDANGNFSAGTITATLNGNASTATKATTADKLSNTSAVGGTTVPVYFTKNGVPAVCTSISLKASTAGTADTATKLGTSDKGSATKPIYLKGGTATECTTYAGGTAVTLNNSSKAGSTASFYAPTGAGTAGEDLVSSGGTSAPAWHKRVYFSTSAPSSTSGYVAGDIWIQY